MLKFAVFVVGIWVVTLPSSADGRDIETQARMKGIAGDLKRILPIWVQRESRLDSAERERFRVSVISLAARSDELQAHAVGKGQPFELLARSLRNDAATIREYADRGDIDAARSQIGPLLENCVGCHSRLPSAGTSSLSASLVSDINLDELSVPDRLRLRMATRQFDPAIADLERILVDETKGRASGAPLTMSLHSGLVDYLILNVRVRNNLERPRAFLTSFGALDGVGKYLRTDIDQWIESLARGPETIRKIDRPLDQAKRLIEQGDELRVFPSDSVGLAYDVMASGVIYRLLETPPASLSNAELAEAYYILGATESRILRPSWNDRWDDYLEMSIRTAPGSDTAWRAYQLLENETLAYWSPSWTATLPSSVRTRLDELRKAAEGNHN